MTLGEASRGNAKHSQLSFVLAGRRSSIPETVVMDMTVAAYWIPRKCGV